MTAVVDNVAGGVVGNLAYGERTNDNRPTITGNGAEAGAKIEIVLALGNQGWGSNNPVYTTTARADGTWSLEIPTALNDGTWYFRAKQTDLAGNTSALGNQRYVVVDTVAAAPVVTAVVDNVAGGTVGNLADGERTNDNRPTITGNGAEAGAKIEIVLALGNQGWGGNNLVYTTTAKADGSWSLEIPQALDNGTWYFRAKQTDIAGNTSALGNQKYINISVQTSGFENFDAVQTTQYGKGTVTLASGLKLTLTDNFYPGYGGAIYQNRPGNHVLAPTGNLTMHFDGVNAVSMKLSGANDSIQSSVVKSTYIVYDTAGKVITSGYLPSGDNATFSVNAPSGREIGDIVFNMGRGTGSLQPGGGNTINQDQYFIDDVRWTVNTSSPAAKSMMMSMDDHHDDNASIVTTLNDREINLDNLQHHTINMTDGKQDKLSISLNDVLTHAEKDLFVTDGHKQLMVQGNKGDVLNLNDLLPDNSDPGNWTNAGNVKVSGVEYQVFHMESQDVELLVQTGVTVNVNNH